MCWKHNAAKSVSAHINQDQQVNSAPGKSPNMPSSRPIQPEISGERSRSIKHFKHKQRCRNKSFSGLSSSGLQNFKKGKHKSVLWNRLSLHNPTHFRLPISEEEQDNPLSDLASISPSDMQSRTRHVGSGEPHSARRGTPDFSSSQINRAIMRQVCPSLLPINHPYRLTEYHLYDDIPLEFDKLSRQKNPRSP